MLASFSSAALWRVPGFHLFPHHVAAVRSSLARAHGYVAIIHQPRLLIPAHRLVLDSIPVSSPVRTLFDLAAAGIHESRLERAMDNLWARGLVDHRTLVSTLAMLAQRGRPGITVMRRLMAERGPNYRPMESNLEFRFRDLLRRAGLPDMARQVHVGDEQSWLGRVDFANVEQRLLVQIDSERYHSALIDARRDAEQTAALVAAGWVVLRFTDVDVWHRSDRVIAKVRDAQNRDP